jgi:metal-responsive CopG/Arc/MetJ family transcriptional regulator
MKISGAKKPVERKLISLRIDKTLIARCDEIGKKNYVARQRLIELILRKALADPKFIVDLSH